MAPGYDWWAARIVWRGVTVEARRVSWVGEAWKFACCDGLRQVKPEPTLDQRDGEGMPDMALEQIPLSLIPLRVMWGSSAELIRQKFDLQLRLLEDDR